MADDFDPYHRWLGIAPKDQPANHYRLLGLELFESDPEVIDSAADRQMAHVRTFQSGPHSAHSQKVLNALSAARLCLLDPRKRSAYDEVLQAQLDAAKTPQPTASPAPAPSTPMPSIAAPSMPGIETNALAPTSPSAPPPVPGHFGPHMAPAPRYQPAPSTSLNPYSVPVSAAPRASNLPIILFVAVLGFVFLLLCGIVGAVVWLRLNRDPQQPLAAKTNKTNEPIGPNVEEPTKPIPPGEFKPPPIQPTIQLPPPRPVSSPPMNTPPVLPPSGKTPSGAKPPESPRVAPASRLVQAPIHRLSVVARRLPDAEVPLEIKLPKSEGWASFTPDNSLLLLPSKDRLEIWVLAHRRSNSSIGTSHWQHAVSPDGQKLAVVQTVFSQSSPVISIFELATLDLLRRLSRPPDMFRGEVLFRPMGFDSTSSKLFTYTDTDLQVWDVSSGKLLRHIKPQMPPIFNPSVQSLNGRYLTVEGALTYVLNTETEELIPIQLNSREMQVTHVGPEPSWKLGSWSFSADGQKLYGKEQITGMFLNWSLPEVKLNSGLLIEYLWFARISPDDTRMIIELQSDRNTLHVLDRTSLQTISTFKSNVGIISSCAISPDNRWFFLAGQQESCLYDLGPRAAAKN